MLILTSSNNYVTSHFLPRLHRPAPASEIRLTFIPTAAEVEEGSLSWLHDDRQALVDAGFPVTDFTLTGKTPDEVRSMLKSTDFVFVSGGNTFYLLQEMRRSGFADMIRDFVDKGMIYGGSSAGSIVAGPNIAITADLDDPSLAPQLTDYEGLNLTDVIVLPHWGSPHFQERYFKTMQNGYKTGNKVILLTDDQYLIVENDTYTIESIV
jgi:dipeptidase E